jgi:5-methylcytosine-specific restriction endonuclease McrA
MKKHTRVYLEHFGFDTETFIPCEVCGTKAVDIHHIHRRGMGGSKSADNIDNLMAVCRICHIKYGDLKKYMDFLKEVHSDYMEKMNKNNNTTKDNQRWEN